MEYEKKSNRKLYKEEGETYYYNDLYDGYTTVTPDDQRRNGWIGQSKW